MNPVLDKILDVTRTDLKEKKGLVSLSDMERRARETPLPRPFAKVLNDSSRTAVIAEMKASSPSAGLLRDPYEPAVLAAVYEKAGARALSVLTEPHFFGGCLDHLGVVRGACSLPVLRKDFVVDPYQIFEARCYGADAVLLIVRVLSDTQLVDLLGVARSLALDALVEIHEASEMERAVKAGATLIGINSRNLDDLSMDPRAFERLSPGAPSGAVLVAESGVKTVDDVQRLRHAGAKAVLVGESFLRETDVHGAVRKLVLAGGGNASNLR